MRLPSAADLAVAIRTPAVPPSCSPVSHRRRQRLPPQLVPRPPLPWLFRLLPQLRPPAVPPPRPTSLWPWRPPSLFVLVVPRLWHEEQQSQPRTTATVSCAPAACETVACALIALPRATSVVEASTPDTPVGVSTRSSRRRRRWSSPPPAVMLPVASTPAVLPPAVLPPASRPASGRPAADRASRLAAGCPVTVRHAASYVSG